MSYHGTAMPEGPEVRYSADMLAQHLVGRHIINAYPTEKGRYAKKPPTGWEAFINEMRDLKVPCKVLEIDAKGKFLWWKLAYPGGKTWWMWNTYGMSGQWNKNETRYTAFGIYHVAGVGCDVKYLYFNDIRHYGTLKFVDSEAEHQRKLGSLGPDMLVDPPEFTTFMGRLMRRREKTLAEALMDQSVVSGVGNYVKAEALYSAHLSPHRVVKTLSANEIEQLRKQVINVMRASYNTGGATISTYLNPDGTPGEAQRRFVVYGNRTDLMGNSVVREETKDGRTTHWVPAVQR